METFQNEQDFSTDHLSHKSILGNQVRNFGSPWVKKHTWPLKNVSAHGENNEF